MKSALFAALAAAILSGCASQAQQDARNAWRANFYATVPECSTEKQCQLMWDAAQVFVVKNSGMKIQTSTNVLIETYNPTNSSPALAIRVLKEPSGEGRYKFNIMTWCANIFGCSPDRYLTAQSFNDTLNEIKGK